jgi:hypothetical protein
MQESCFIRWDQTGEISGNLKSTTLSYSEKTQSCTEKLLCEPLLIDRDKL